ncbi:hypothetical protein CRG98_042794 [Punica granatum]|uniref:Uncharacterized protein n=1 Tax=Punica granatum TaxID=22663 RepID=A0A2I0HYR7_PUNGR|nr:hypothetical protein CRG98_042794 [Punica granatum]
MHALVGALTLRQAQVWNFWPVKSESGSESSGRSWFDPPRSSVEGKAHLEVVKARGLKKGEPGLRSVEDGCLCVYATRVGKE